MPRLTVSLSPILGGLSSVIWILDGVMIAGSFALNTAAWAINLAVSVPFLFIGLIIGWHTFALNTVLKTLGDRKPVLHLASAEIGVQSISLIVGIIAASAIASRVFGEGLPVFG